MSLTLVVGSQAWGHCVVQEVSGAHLGLSNGLLDLLQVNSTGQHHCVMVIRMHSTGNADGRKLSY